MSNIKSGFSLHKLVTTTGRPSIAANTPPSQDITTLKEFSASDIRDLWEYVSAHPYDTVSSVEDQAAKIGHSTDEVSQWLRTNRRSLPVKTTADVQAQSLLFTENDLQIFEIIIQSKRDWKRPGFLDHLLGILDSRRISVTQLRHWFTSMSNMDSRSGLVSSGKQMPSDTPTTPAPTNLPSVTTLSRRTGYHTYYSHRTKQLKGRVILDLKGNQ